jgi:hypothetical protein
VDFVTGEVDTNPKWPGPGAWRGGLLDRHESWNMTNDVRPGYRAVRLGLRAPRVVLVVDGDAGWESSTALALYTAGRVWGGAVFSVIPHHNGVVDPVLLRVSQVYDPDYVLISQTSVREYEEIFPGQISIGVDGELIGGKAMLDQLGDLPDRDMWPEYEPGGGRETVLEACSAYRQRLEDDGEWTEPLITIHHSQIEGTLVPSESVHGPQAGPQLTVPSGLGGSIGLAVAMRCGFSRRPDLPFHGPDDLDSSELSRLIRYCTGREGPWVAPQLLCRFPDGRVSTMSTQNAPTAWDPSTTGLVSVAPLRPDRAATLVVFGSTSDDFALALAWDRMFGNGVWVPESWVTDDATARSAVVAALQDRVTDATRTGRKILGTSLSLPEDAVTRHLAKIADAAFLPTEPVARARQQRRVDEATSYARPWDIPFARPGHLACADQFDLAFSLPAGVDHTDTVTFLVPVPEQMPTAPPLQAVSELEWQVDVGTAASTMPTGRGLPGDTLLADGGTPWNEWIRSGRDGISFSSRSWGFIPAGASRRQTLAHPQLRVLGLQPWVECMLANHAKAATLSPSGTRAEILRRIWGERAQLAADLAGQLRPFFREFLATDKASSKAYPDHDGVVLNPSRLEGYLTFDAARRVLGDVMDEAGVRAELDRLLVCGALRRGLVLGCRDCDDRQFVAVDELGQNNRCRRCGASNPLTQPQWHKPSDEPRWFYDLHAVARDLLVQHGDIPLLAGDYLRRKARSFADTAELELFNHGEPKPYAEIDIIATADDMLVIGEAKTQASLGANKELRKITRKLLDLANQLRADQIILCTTDTEPWPDKEITHLRGAISHHTWPRGRPPILRLVTGLGGNKIDDVS